MGVYISFSYCWFKPWNNHVYRKWKWLHISVVNDAANLQGVTGGNSSSKEGVGEHWGSIPCQFNQFSKWNWNLIHALKNANNVLWAFLKNYLNLSPLAKFLIWKGIDPHRWWKWIPIFPFMVASRGKKVGRQVKSLVDTHKKAKRELGNMWEKQYFYIHQFGSPHIVSHCQQLFYNAFKFLCNISIECNGWIRYILFVCISKFKKKSHSVSSI